MSKIIYIYLLVYAVIVIHEMAHFLVAYNLGLAVASCELGTGPALWHRQWKGINFNVRLFPWEGKVRMAFTSRKKWKNLSFIAAGPAANILTFLALWTPGSQASDFASISLLVGLLNLNPFWNGSDGQHIWRLIRP